MSHVFEGFQVAAWTATEIENAKGTFTPHMLKQCGAVLCDVMIASAFPETIRVLIVVIEGDDRYFGEFVLGYRMLKGHVRSEKHHGNRLANVQLGVSDTA
jgi:hypothetical protein